MGVISKILHLAKNFMGKTLSELFFGKFLEFHDVFGWPIWRYHVKCDYRDDNCEKCADIWGRRNIYHRQVDHYLKSIDPSYHIAKCPRHEQIDNECEWYGYKNSLGSYFWWSNKVPISLGVTHLFLDSCLHYSKIWIQLFINFLRVKHACPLRERRAH